MRAWTLDRKGSPLKVGIVGSGFVGATAAYAMVLGDVAHDIVLVDVDHARAEGEAMDISHATPFSHPVRVVAGRIDDLRGCGVVLLAAGANQGPGETRLDLAARNAAIFREVVPAIASVAPDTILLVATNPVDVLTVVAREASGFPASRVIGSGTTLDTARLRALVGAELGISPKHVHGYVLGEHGDSEFVAWSTLRVAGLDSKQLGESLDVVLDEEARNTIDRDVREAAYRIIDRKRATYYGVGAALSRIVAAIADDEGAVLTVSIDEGGVAYSLPRIVDASGVRATLDPGLSDVERAALQRSADVVRSVVRAVS